MTDTSFIEENFPWLISAFEVQDPNSVLNTPFI